MVKKIVALLLLALWMPGMALCHSACACDFAPQSDCSQCPVCQITHSCGGEIIKIQTSAAPLSTALSKTPVEAEFIAEKAVGLEFPPNFESPFSSWLFDLRAASPPRAPSFVS